MSSMGYWVNLEKVISSIGRFDLRSNKRRSLLASLRREPVSLAADCPSA